MATSIEHRLQIGAAVKKADIIFGMGHGVLLLPLAQRMFLSPITLNENVVSAAVFALYSCRDSSRTFGEARSTSKCPAYRARRSLALTRTSKNPVRLINPMLAQRYRHHVSLALSRHPCPRLVIWWFTAFPQVRETSRSWRRYTLLGLRIRKTVSVQR
jgi:hypothetical protein